MQTKIILCRNVYGMWQWIARNKQSGRIVDFSRNRFEHEKDCMADIIFNGHPVPKTKEVA